MVAASPARSRPNRNAFPEDVRYIDRGCPGVCERSLDCPFEQCVLDIKGGRTTLEHDLLKRRARELKQTTTLPINDIATLLGVSRRTVFRLLRGEE